MSVIPELCPTKQDERLFSREDVIKEVIASQIFYDAVEEHINQALHNVPYEIIFRHKTPKTKAKKK